ncbi:MAG: OsmC family protein [Gemmatimonadota bacterium]|nr:OsmC family protein [Gemmatimonadota bacterium]
MSETPGRRPPNVVHLTWAGERRFDAGRPNGPTIRVDGDSTDGQPSPVDALLAGLGSCVSVDVVDILKKQRTPPDAYFMEVVGTRVETTPRRLQHVLLKVRVRGPGIERAQVERAVELAVTKYCSVRDSLRPDVPVEWAVEIEG